jgi:predicted methyltransferase
VNSNKPYFEVVDREILKNLLKQERIDWYYFHEKYMLSPGQLSRSIKKLEELKLLVVEDDKIKITEEGRKTIISNRNKMLRKNKDEYWELPQEERKGITLGVNQFYLPNDRKINK